MEHFSNARTSREPWNKGTLVGQKAAFKLKEIWAIRVRLQLADGRRELALFNLAIDSKPRACDLLKLRVRDVCHGQAVASRTIVLQQKTPRPVQFEITEPIREAVGAWIGHARLTSENSPFPSRLRGSTHFVDAAVRPNCRILGQAAEIGPCKRPDAHAQADNGHVDQSPYEKSPGSAAAAWAHEAGKYSAIPWH